MALELCTCDTQLSLSRIAILATSSETAKFLVIFFLPKYILVYGLIKSGAARVSNSNLPYVKAGFAAPDRISWFILGSAAGFEPAMLSCVSIASGTPLRLSSFLPRRHPYREVFRGDETEGLQPLTLFRSSFCIKPLHIPLRLPSSRYALLAATSLSSRAAARPAHPSFRRSRPSSPRRSPPQEQDRQ